MLTERLRTLEKAEIIFRQSEPTVPPQVTYGLTTEGRELTTVLDQLNTIAESWQEQAENGNETKGKGVSSNKTLLKVN